MKIKKYADGRWGWDDYSSGKRRMVRYRLKEKAMAHIKAERKQEQIDPVELRALLRWQSDRTSPHPLCKDGRLRRNGMTEAERLVWEHVSSWEDSEILKCGWPDFLVAHAGSIYCLEVKIGDDPIRDKQKRVHEILRKAGIETFIVRDGWCEELQKRFAPPQQLQAVVAADSTAATFSNAP